MPVDSSALPGIEKPREQLFAGVDEFVASRELAPFLLTGPQASGRRALLRSVADYARGKGQSVFELEILPFGHDTPAQVLLHVAALAPDSSHAKALTSLETSWKERLEAAEALLEDAPADVFLVRFPAGGLPSGERADRQLQQESADVVGLVTKPRKNKLHVVAAQRWWSWPHVSPPTEVRLRSSSRSGEFLLEASQWGSLAPLAARLAKLLGGDGDKASPLQLRLGVALLATGTSGSVVRNALAPGSNLRDLELPLRKMLEAQPPLEAALTRVARARTAVDSTVLRDVASAGPDWELISKCFLYPEEEGRLRFHDQLRWLVPDSSPEPVTHARLLDYYGALDGATDPTEGLRRVAPWLEKLHHASRADESGDLETWLALNPPTREHFWEYGWSLSYVHKRFSAAARVYRELLSRIPDEDDNYAQHYYAYNLDKAGEDPITAEAYFHKAVDGDPANAWWNARLVGFLTERGCFEPALKAWSAALEATDPGGERSGGDGLPYQLHKHVIQAGLDSGNLELAKVACRAIRPPAASAEIFCWLASRVEAACEVRRLGEALFPASVSFPEWWTPRLLRPRHGETMAEWRAGRVLRADSAEVSVALGFRPESDGPVVEHQVLARGVWDEAAQGQEARAGDFFEVALIDGHRRLESESPRETPVDRAYLDNLLRYLSTQACPS